MALHHQVVRRLLLQHAGYESATEGDSFILAFHNATQAVGGACCAVRWCAVLLCAVLL